MDFLLNYTFYARQNTRTPAIVGVIAVGFYFIAALALKGPLGFLGLVLADSVKQAGHAVIMTVLLLRSVGRLHRERILSTLAGAAGASLLMGGLVWLLARWLEPRMPPGIVGEVIVVALAGAAGGAFYLGILRLLRVPEVAALLSPFERLIGRARR